MIGVSDVLPCVLSICPVLYVCTHTCVFCVTCAGHSGLFRFRVILHEVISDVCACVMHV